MQLVQFFLSLVRYECKQAEPLICGRGDNFFCSDKVILSILKRTFFFFSSYGLSWLRLSWLQLFDLVLI